MGGVVGFDRDLRGASPFDLRGDGIVGVLMSAVPIVRQQLQFEREFGMYRNWWFRDSRVAGMPITIFVNLQSHQVDHEVTPAMVKQTLGLTDYAWKTAKNTLRRHGFLIEVRDRYPAGSKAPMLREGAPVLDRRGRQRYVDLTGNLRVRVFTQDPEPGVDVGPNGGVIEVDAPYEEWIARQQQMVSGGFQAPVVTARRNSRGGDNTLLRASPASEKPHVSTAPRNSWGGAPVDDIRNTHIKEEENQDGKDGINNPNPSHPSNSNHGREAGPGADALAVVDAELQAIHQTLSVTAMKRELRDRVDVAEVDLARACREILAANRQPGGVRYPPAYCAKSIAESPDRWRVNVTPFRVFEPTANEVREHLGQDACKRGDHDWGSAAWREIDRAHCVRTGCEAARRSFDPAFAGLEDEFEQVRGGR